MATPEQDISRTSSTASSDHLSVGAETHDSFDVGDTKVQHYGMLLKKPFGHKSARWQKRFFIVKEGFLLYYPESEGKNFEKSHHFNIHPKGVIPLGRCHVETKVSGPQKHAIRITNEHFKGEIWVGAESPEECQEWVQVLNDAGKVTWRNAQLGEVLVEKSEEKSKELAAEMKQAIDKLNEEASALEIEKEKKTELEELAAKLEAEKAAIEAAAKNLRVEKDTAQQELSQTMSAMQQIEKEKETLSEKTENLLANLESAAKEKEKTEAELEERERLARQLEEEKKQLEEATTHLKDNLETMEERQKRLQREMEERETMLQEQELTAKQLEAEKKQISDTALHLQQNLEQVSFEKTKSDSRWKEERKRRLHTEKRLRLAEDSLKRLDKALKESGVQIDIQIETDVKNLREYFEECIKEEEFEAHKLNIMRDAVRAKQTYTTEAERVSVPEDPPLSPRETSPVSPTSPTPKTNGNDAAVANGQ